MSKGEKIACPKCDWEPDGGAYWSCTCSCTWNTFTTAGQCPSCGRQWKKTQCIPHRGGCHEWSLHVDWYRDLDDWVKEEIEQISLQKEGTA